MRAFTRVDRIKACGLAGARPDGEVVVRHTPAGPDSGPVTGFSGLFACGSVWLCPECAQKVAARRAARLEAALRFAVEHGGWAVLVTFTVRHHDRMSLATLLDAVRTGWRAARSGKVAQAERRALGVLGVVRSIEITHGHNGWHPHVHALIVFDRPPSSEQVTSLARGMFARWSRAVVRSGLPAPLRDQGGLDITQLGAGTDTGVYASLSAWSRYAVKGITGEAVMGVAKDARGSNRSIRQLMSDALIGRRLISDDGRITHVLDDTARALLAEYERETRRVKYLTGLAELESALGLDADEATDEEIVNEDAGGQDVAVVSGGYWDELVEPAAAELAAAGERHGPDGIRDWLTRHGVPWTWPTGSGRTWQTIREDRDNDTARILAAAGTRERT